ncbi:MAG: ribonuclease D [Gammaproteobacteria bacterium]
MSTSQKTHYVDTQAALAACLGNLANHDCVAVDTEFVRERTYYPKLCLIQLAAGDAIWCIDTIAIPNIKPLFDALETPRLLKIFHSARQDLELFFNHTGHLPTPLFDTQIAAALLGRPDQIAYAGLVKEYFSLELDKSSSRTDWTNRPLSVAQVEYAADDVRYLAEIKQFLQDELVERSRQSWLVEECERLCRVDLYDNDPDLAWRKVKGIEKLEPKLLASAVSIAIWRERVAQRRDLPRGWVLKDDRIVAIARATPQSLADLSRIDGISPGAIRRDGDEILNALREDVDESTTARPSAHARLSKAGKALVREFLDALATVAAKHQVSSSIIATRRELEFAVRGEESIRFYSGWRRQLFGESVQQRIEGSSENLTL